MPKGTFACRRSTLWQIACPILQCRQANLSLRYWSGNPLRILRDCWRWFHDTGAKQRVNESRFDCVHISLLLAGLVGSRRQFSKCHCADRPVSRVPVINIIIVPVDISSHASAGADLYFVSDGCRWRWSGVNKVKRNRELTISATMTALRCRL